MALGFQRIHDLSPLSLKLLNDQLDTLWKKMMGGLETKDMIKAVAAQINSAVTAENFTSLIEQNADEIRLAVGSTPTGGENLLRNSGAQFGNEGWEAEGCALEAGEDAGLGRAFFVDGPGAIWQEKIQLKAGTEYALCFSFRCEQGVHAEIPELSLVGGAEGSVEYADYKLCFTTQEAVEVSARIVFGGAGSVGEILLCEGDGGKWRQNPNELKNSSITLTDERVAIDTANFALRLYNPQGAMVTEMSADALGFSTLTVAENIDLRGRPMYLGTGRYYLWVHPDAPKMGERRMFSSGTEPLSLEGCYPDVQEAIDAIPRWCDGEVVVSVWCGGAWQYPVSKVEIANFFGGGSFTLTRWGTTSYTLKRMDIHNNSMDIRVMFASINSCGAGDGFRVRNSSCQMNNCNVNGRGVMAGYGGYDASFGATLVLSSCQAHNCGIGALAQSGGRIYVEDGAGAGNTVSLRAATGGIIQISRTIFQGTTLHQETDGGKILTPVTATLPGTPPATTPMEYLAQYYGILSGRTDGKTNQWVTSPDWIKAGNGDRGILWFDIDAVKAQLRLKTIVSASLTIRRRGEGGRPGGVQVQLQGIYNKTPTGAFMGMVNYGVIGSWRWGEKKTVSIPTAAITALALGTAAGFAFLAGEEIALEGVSEAWPLLEVIYK